MSIKSPVVVYAFHTEDSSGGFFWAPDVPENRAALLSEWEKDRDFGDTTSGTVALFQLKPWLTDEAGTVAQFIEWELQDSLEMGYVGKILARYNREGEDA